jgi:hypothetical protein
LNMTSKFEVRTKTNVLKLNNLAATEQQQGRCFDD